jgi:cystathionine beta-synthase
MRNPQITIVGEDTEGSLYTNKEVKPSKIEGIGEDSIPCPADLGLIDAWETISDREAFPICRCMAREEGILVGGLCKGPEVLQ